MKKRTVSGASYLITGGAGFIGSHLAETLLAGGCRVVAVDDLSTGSRSNIEAIASHPRFQFHYDDVTRPGVLAKLAASADVVVHLAAAVGVKLIVDQPRRTIRTNLQGAMMALDAAERHGCRLVLASSSEVYGKSAEAPFQEDSDVVLGPTSRSRWSYAAAKMMGEFLALAYQREGGVDAAILRFFNTIGPRQSGQYGMVAPRFIRQALVGEPITVYGDGSQTRCFCDVRDVVEAIIRVAECSDISGEVLNVGGERETSIGELAERIRDLAASPSAIVRIPYEDAYEPGFEDIPRRIPDSGKLRRLTGWAPRYTLEETLRAIIEHEARETPRMLRLAAAGD